MKKYPALDPAENERILISRVYDFLTSLEEKGKSRKKSKDHLNNQSDFFCGEAEDHSIETPFSSVKEFLDFAADVSYDGGAYIFGGALRDLAMFGRNGFTSDIDIVIDGSWDILERALIRKNAVKNKFGGLRIWIGNLPIDIWKSDKTWAFQKEFFEYHGIHSLLETTILNWDSILMDWKRKKLICGPNYFSEIVGRRLDIIFENNPNRLGMLVRVLRHLHHKDAQKITRRACNYLARETSEFPYKLVHQAEIKSYQSAIITRQLYEFFRLENFDGCPEETSVSEILNPMLF